MNELQKAQILRWRKRQILSVATGSLAGLLGLIGLSMGSVWLVLLGFTGFLLALLMILVSGIFAARVAQSGL